MKNAILFLVVLCCSALSVRAQSQTISYQGVLSNTSGGPADSGTYSVTVTFYSDEGGTHPLWQDTYATEVRKGIFNIALGSNKPLPKATEMDGPIWVGTAINGTAETRPLARLGAVPFAMNVADNSITANKLATDYVSSITVNGAKVTGRGTGINIATGEGLNASIDPGTNTLLLSSGVRTSTTGKGDAVQTHVGGGAVDYWGETGNTSISVPTNFIGTADATSNAFEIHLEDGHVTAPLHRVFHIELPYSSYSPSIIWGYGAGAGSGSGNSIAAARYGSTIAGGGLAGNLNSIDGSFSFIGSGLSNTVSADSSSIVGGSQNTIKSDAPNGFIGGGTGNEIGNTTGTISGSAVVSGFSNKVHNITSIIGGGTGNKIGEDGDSEPTYYGDVSSVIAGGDNNVIYEGHSFIGGGSNNNITADAATWSSIVGGDTNRVEGPYDAVLGGHFNRIDLNKMYSSIGGGDSNEVSGDYQVVGGGDANHARGKGVVIAGGGHDVVGTSDSDINGVDFAVIGGGEYDTIDGNQSSHSAITGGEQNSIKGDTNSNTFIGGGKQNRIAGHGIAYSVITGGQSNSIHSSSEGGVIAGGVSNTIDSGAMYVSIGGGRQNLVQGPFSVIAGGENNYIYFLGADHNVVGGGYGNVEENPSFGVIAGGWNNLLDTAAWGSTIGGGDSNIVQPPLSFIGGGRMNRIDDLGWADGGAIVGGYHNRMVHGVFSFIGAGESNFLQDEHSTLVGGYSDTMYGYGEFLGGGIKNTIYWGSDTATLVGGSHNYIGGGKFSFLGGGVNDSVISPFSVLGGGQKNKIDYAAPASVLTGGDSNLISSSYGAIVGGLQNSISSSSSYSTVAGGRVNSVAAANSTISGGDSNSIISGSPYSTISGGDSNAIEAHSRFSQIAGGSHNFIDTGSVASAVSGGNHNVTQAKYTVIAGGHRNWIEFDTLGMSVIAGGGENTVEAYAGYSSIGGGIANVVGSTAGTIGGGIGNSITTGGQSPTIGGGQSNEIMSYYSTIGGGNGNLIYMQHVGCSANAIAPVGTIAGGVTDTIGDIDARWVDTAFYHTIYMLGSLYTSPIHGSIAGGLLNTVNGGYGSVGGGYKNHSVGMGSTIPGGIGLEARDYQTVVGKYNFVQPVDAQLGHLDFSAADTVTNIGDKFTFVVGNGVSADSAHRSDAFEVSDNGHSIVHHTLGSAASVIYGATYQDNISYAWGDVTGSALAGPPCTGTTALVSDFGVVSVVYICKGQYRVKLNIIAPDGTTAVHLSNGFSVTATPVSPIIGTPPCRIVTVTPLGAGGNSDSFDIFILDPSNSCVQVDGRVMFQVCGRK